MSEISRDGEGRGLGASPPPTLSEEVRQAGKAGGRPGLWGRLAAGFLAAILVFLVVRAADPDRWSDWDFGEAQVLLGLRQWQEGGWLANYLLHAPQGYAKPIDHFEDPELRQHAHGIGQGISPRVGPRRRYTHYPAGYLVPYAVLYELGVRSKATLRMLSIGMSLAALILMYLLFARLADPAVAFFALLFYGLSPIFLEYADAVANQPLDDLLRFAFMLLVVLSTRAAADRARRRALGAAWGLEFLLSLTSYDSVFFLFVWLVGWDLVEGRGFRWRKYLVFAAGPVAAFGLQVLQNTWYLGWQDATRDLVDTLFFRIPGTGSSLVKLGVLESIGKALEKVFRMLFPRTAFLWVIAALYLPYRLFLRKDRPAADPPLRLLGLLFLCGFAFVALLPHAALMDYEGRQMAPFAALLVGGVTSSFARGIAPLLRRGAGAPRRARRGFRAAPLLLAGTMLCLVWGPVVKDFILLELPMPRYVNRDHFDVRLAKHLARLPTAHDPVIFNLWGFHEYWNLHYHPGYPQIHPVIEYYAGSQPILSFLTRDLLVRDLATLARKAPRDFSPLLVARLGEMNAVFQALTKNGVVKYKPTHVQIHGSRFVVDLTDAMAW